ncbi:MAG: hypothetical protein JNG85_06975 [Spirochaetaceae bacterium]|nr:hypothetical protein [Spirochaetaceae bacterium]
MFAANALLVYGLGACPALRGERRGLLVSILALLTANLIASSLLWALRELLLAPFGLEALEPLVFALIIAPLVKYLGRAIATSGAPLLQKAGAAIDEAAVSCLVFGIALISARSNFGLLEALTASIGACVGYWAALVLLGAVRERLELSDLPESFRGAPAILVSAGLMAMAFMGIDAVFIGNLVG